MISKLQIALCLVVLFLQSCSATTVTPKTPTAIDARSAERCDRLKASTLPALSLSRVGSSDEFLAWVATQPSLVTAKIKLENSEDGAQSAAWESAQAEYGLVFGPHNDRRLNVIWTTPETPIVGDVLRCFGGPQYYRAYNKSFVDRQQFIGELWYPSNGLKFWLVDPLPVKKVGLDTVVKGLVVGRPGSAESLAIDVFPNVKSASEARSIVEQLRPWPGRVEAIQIEEVR